MIEITSRIALQDDEVQLDFVQASGPGGQNVNKVATAVQLRFNVRESPSLDDGTKARLTKLAGKRMTDDGVLIIDARRYRTQGRNREDALDRLRRLVHRASVVPKRRRKTRPTKASKERRLAAKRQRGEKKRLRGPIARDD